MMKKLWVILMVLCLCLGMVTTAQAEVNSGGEVDLHDLTYSAAGGVLTQTCLHDGCDHLATATLIVPESVEFTGSAVTPGEVACLDNWYGSQPTISYTGNTAPGEGSASISAGVVTAMKTFRIIGKTSTITYSMTDTGHVIGPVSAACGDTVTVMIFPAAEYELDELIVWQGATRIPVSSLDGDFTFTMPGGNVKVIPTFRKLYTIHCAESQMGTVSVNETVRYPGETVELTIDLNEGVEMSECVVVAFVTTNGAQVSMANTGDGYRFIMPSSNVMVQLLPAEVSSASYNVKWEIDGEEYARTVAQYGQVVDYVELPYRDGYLNHGWYTQPNGEGQRISMMTVFRDTSDTTYYAYYEALDADVFVDTNSDDESVLTRMNYIKVGTPIASVASIIEALVNNGTIKKTGDTFRGIKCYTDANHTTEYSETTVPTRLYVVLEWEADPYKVIVLPMENGYTVTADKSEAFSDETITLNAQTEAGWELDSFIVKDASGNDVTVSADGTFTMPASDVTVSATFRKTVYMVDVAEVLGGVVTVDKSEATMDETITLNAQTEAGLELDSFIVKDASGNDVTVSADGTFTMPASDVTVSATFRKTVYTVDVAEVLGGVVTVDKSEATMDETITLNAQTEAGWELDSFIVKDASGNDVTVSADGTFTMPASDVTVSATFRKTVYTVDVAEVIGGVVTVDKSEATMDETITVTITADEGYELSYVQWQTSGQSGPDARPEDGVYTFTMPADNVTVYAGFSAREFVVAFAETANGTITFVDGFANPFMFGEPVSLSFQPDEGCEWDETVSITGASGTDYSDRFDAASRGFTMPAEDVEVLAEFRRTDPEEQEVSLRLEWIDEAGDTLDDWIYGYIGLMMVDNLSTIEAVLPAGENTLSFDDQMVPGGYVKPEDVILKIEDGIVSSESAHAAVELADGVWLITITIESDGASDTTTRVLPAALEAIDSEGNVIEQLVSGLIGDDVVNNGNVTDVSLANGANTLMIIEVPNGYQIPGNAVIMLSGDNITTDAPHVVLELHEEYVLIRVTLEEAIDDCYTLTVVNGTGSGQFAAGTEVTISADAPEAGKQFAVCEGLEGLTIVGGSIDHENVSFIMPAHDVTATAAYEDAEEDDPLDGGTEGIRGYTLTVVNGTGSGQFAAGTKVTISADAPEAGKQFAVWEGLEGLTIVGGSIDHETVSFIMPAHDVTATAAYEDAEEDDPLDGGTEGIIGYTLTVVNGTGSDQFAAGTEVTISANAPEAGKQFAVWEGLEGLTIVGGSIDHETVSFIMPAHDVTATAAYEDVDAEAVTVTFHANGGEGIMAAQTFTVGVVDHLASNSFVREGCDFVTWNTAADGSGESYADGAALALNHDLVLYAQWREKDASAAVPVITAPTKAQTVTVTEGETATMAVSAENAAAWQWYINYNDGTGWHKRGSGASYTTGAVELSNSGYRYKCVVTGIGGYTDESPVFTLEVLKKIDVPQTGDATTPGLWLMLSLMSFTGLVMLIRNRQKERKE